ncbi:hypothetical protein BST61_g7167 [Cercospora zeina]
MQARNIRSADFSDEAQEQNPVLPLPAGSMAPNHAIKRKPLPARNEMQDQDICPASEKKHDSKMAVRGKKIPENKVAFADIEEKDLVPPPLFIHSRNKRNSVGIRAEKPSERKPHPDLRPRSQGVYELLSGFHRKVMEDVEEEEGDHDDDDDDGGEEEDLAMTTTAVDFWTKNPNPMYLDEPCVCDSPELAQFLVKDHSDRMNREEKTMSDSRLADMRGERARTDSVVSGARKVRGWSSPEGSHSGSRQCQARTSSDQSHGKRSERWWEFE